MFFDHNKLTVMRTVLQERMLALNLIDYDSYYRLLNDHSYSQPLSGEGKLQPPTGHRVLSREMRRLVEGLAVNETAFFRNREHYRALREEVLPRLFRRLAKTRHLRIWSAGCSTGQEPYSLAIAIVEILRSQGQSPTEWHIEIIASDISERALRVAYNGRYRLDEMRGLSAEQIKAYFQPLSAHTVATAPLDPDEIYKPGHNTVIRHRQRMAYEINPQIRQMIDFNFFNLTMAHFPQEKFKAFDLVLCENVTIYFTPEVTRQVMNNIYAAMNEGAFLFIGYSETLWQVSDRYKLINTQDTFYYQKPFPHEEPSRYLRRPPTTGPLSDDGLMPPLNRPAGSSNRTDELARRNSKPVEPLPSRNNITDPLPPPTRPVVGEMPVLGGNQPPRVITDPLTPKLAARPAPVRPAAQPSSVSPRPPTPHPNEWLTLLGEGRQLMKEHEFDQALSRLEAALAVGPIEVDTLSTLAELKLKLGDYARAMELCLKAIALNPLAESAHLMLAMIYHKEGRIEEAIQEYKNTIYVNLDAVIAYMRLADIYRDTGHQRDALREYRRALNVLQQKAPDEIIEDLSVGLLMQACQQNITRLAPRSSH